MTRGVIGEADYKSSTSAAAGAAPRARGGGGGGGGSSQGSSRKGCQVLSSIEQDGLLQVVIQVTRAGQQSKEKPGGEEDRRTDAVGGSHTRSHVHAFEVRVHMRRL